MDHHQAVALIREGVAGWPAGGLWAELGAGTGVFTRALGELLGPTGMVYAVDRNASALAQLRAHAPSGAAILPHQADFTKADALATLLADAPADTFDGLLLANSLHFVARQERLLRRIAGYLKPRGALLLVEYDAEQRSPWNPYPVPPGRFRSLATAVGLSQTRELGRRPSKFGNRELYAAVAYKGC